MTLTTTLNKITMGISSDALAKRLTRFVLGTFRMSYDDTQSIYGYVPSQPDERAIDYLKERIIILSEKTADRLKGDLKYQLVEGMKASESITTIKQRLKPIFDDMKDYELERLARNEVMDALNEGRMEAARDDPDTKYKVWQAALKDARTADDSKRLAGQIQLIDKQFVDVKAGKTHDHPPNRPNCRCNVIFIEELPDNVVYRGELMYHPDYMYKGG